MKNKQKQHNDTLMKMLLASEKDLCEFWEAVYKVSFKRKIVRSNITAVVILVMMMKILF